MTTARAEYDTILQEPASPTHASGSSEEHEHLLPTSNEEDAIDIEPPVGVERQLPSQIRWINFALGAAILLPWNALITAMPYFLSRLSGSPFQSTFTSYLSTTFTVAGFFSLAHATITSRQSNFSEQIRWSLLVLTILLLLLATSTLVSLPSALFFSLVILNGVCQSAAGAYLQSAVVAVASLFGPSVIQPVISGQAAVAIVVSLVQVLSAVVGIRTGSKSSDNGTEEASTRAALYFFTLSSTFLILTIILHRWMLTLAEYKAVVIPFEAKKGVILADEERESVLHERQVQRRQVLEKGRIMEVAIMNRELNIAVACVFAVTLSVFPPITSLIQSVHSSSASLLTHPLLFTQLHFLIFNIGDFIGRYLPTLDKFQIWSSRRLLYISLSRTLFIPLFLMCNIQRSLASQSLTPIARTPIINSDIMFFLILLFFGLTNGWICSLTMMAAPSIEHNPRLRNRPGDVDIAATIAQFCLVGGLAVGSFTSFGVKGVMCACNPFTT